MDFRIKFICEKFLYVLFNDIVLFALLVFGYYACRIVPDSTALILLLIVYLGAVFCFYFIRALTVLGDEYDDVGDLAFFIVLKLIFLFLNGLGALVFIARPVIAIPLIGINTLLVSGTQYYRILLLLRRRYEICEGRVISAERYIIHHGTHYRGFSAIHYVAQFEYSNGGIISVCIDRYTYHRIRLKGRPKAKLVSFDFPKGRTYYEVWLG